MKVIVKQSISRIYDSLHMITMTNNWNEC